MSTSSTNTPAISDTFQDMTAIQSSLTGLRIPKIHFVFSIPIVIDSLSYADEVVRSTSQIVPIIKEERQFISENTKVRSTYFDSTPYRFTLRIILDVLSL
jgi:hypothetical protein